MRTQITLPNRPIQSALNRFTSAILIAIALPLCASESKPAETGPTPTTTPDAKVAVTNPTATPRPAESPEIHKGELLGHIKYLSQMELMGREAGTEGHRMTSRYIASEFKRYGLEPHGDENDGARSFRQEFTVKMVKGFGPATGLKLTEGEASTSFEHRKDFAPFLVGKPTVAGTGGVAFVGYGIVAPEHKYDDFGELNIEGRWAVMLRYEPQEHDAKSVFSGRKHTKHASLNSKIGHCAKRKAAGVIIVTGPAGREMKTELLPRERQRRAIGKWKIPVLVAKRHVVDRILKSTGKTIAGLQEAIDKDLSHQSFLLEGLQLTGGSEAIITNEPTHNVIARLPGRDELLRAEAVVVGAHSDHVGLGEFGSRLGDKGRGKIHPGADDNASGVAALLEMAQRFAALKPEQRPKRSVVFMTFSGEEKGLLGSQHYVRNPSIPLKDIVTMLNMDMVGRSRNGHATVSGVGVAKEFKAIVEKHAKTPGLSVKMGRGASAPSDHMSFYRHKIPCMFIFTGLAPDYHTPSDTWEKINAPAAAAIARLLYGITFDIADAENRPTYIDPQSEGVLGIAPARRAGKVKGFTIGRVYPGGAAELAGLKAGDVIIEMDGEAVASADAFTIGLIGQPPGQTIKLKVKRGEEELVIDATLGQRKKRK